MHIVRNSCLCFCRTECACSDSPFTPALLLHDTTRLSSSEFSSVSTEPEALQVGVRRQANRSAIKSQSAMLTLQLHAPREESKCKTLCTLEFHPWLLLWMLLKDFEITSTFKPLTTLTDYTPKHSNQPHLHLLPHVKGAACRDDAT